jgi:hypothetical protein
LLQALGPDAYAENAIAGWPGELARHVLELPTTTIDNSMS